jgi:hypothetical protein
MSRVKGEKVAECPRQKAFVDQQYLPNQHCSSLPSWANNSADCSRPSQQLRWNPGVSPSLYVCLYIYRHTQTYQVLSVLLPTGDSLMLARGHRGSSNPGCLTEMELS